jgi:hypothetical protein
MKKKFALAALLCFVLTMSGCGSSPQSLIVGRWEAGQAGAKLVAEFAQDGKAKITILGQTLQGSYKINGDDELEWTMGGRTTKFKAKVTATQMELSSDGKTIIYTKV